MLGILSRTYVKRTYAKRFGIWRKGTYGKRFGQRPFSAGEIKERISGVATGGVYAGTCGIFGYMFNIINNSMKSLSDDIRSMNEGIKDDVRAMNEGIRKLNKNVGFIMGKLDIPPEQ